MADRSRQPDEQACPDGGFDARPRSHPPGDGRTDRKQMHMATATPTPNDTAPPKENFAALFEESLARQEMRQGELITAEVTRVDYNIVVVNAGLKSESFIPIEEFKNDQGIVEVKAGDFVTVAIESLEDGYGETRLSRDKAKRLKAWHDLEAAMEQGNVVQGLVTGKVKGGLTVMVNGIRAFLPGSLVDIRPVKDTGPFEGKNLEFKVIKLDRKRNNVVVSRRAVLEASLGAEREELLKTLQEGAVVKGVVKNITDYGAFVEIESGIEGLVHVSEMDWTNKNVHPAKVVSLGDEVEVMILEIDEDRRRISLGMKQCMPNPWEEFAMNHKKGNKVKGTVKVIEPQGAVIELDKDVEGYLRASEIARDRVEDVRAHLKEGDTVEAVIVNIDRKSRSINLSIKQKDAAEEAAAMQ